MTTDWSIQQIAKLAGTTSRTLRHYDDVGLVKPSRVGDTGYRYYDADALVRLQRVLLLRELGLGIPAIGEVLAGSRDDVQALRSHLDWLRLEKERVDRQMAGVAHTITEMERGEKPMAEKMFDGFDHTAHRDEVVERWGEATYADGDAWWTAKSAAEKAAFQADAAALAGDWAEAAARGVDPQGDEAQALARRQYDWLSGMPGTPQVDGRPTRAYLEGLGDMYVADERFAANYGGTAGASFVRDALRAFAAREL